MYIKSLKLINFQRHKELQINFVNGVNILYGQSDAGKSCIRRAIEWISQNENIDGIRKTGTKKTSVSITLDNDIEIERIRSQSINRYIIRKNDDEKVFDAVGRTIPDEVKEVLTIYPIEIDGEEIYLNSQPQIGLPFLFDKSSSFRMKLFNKLTGNDILDKLFSEFNRDILRIKRNKKEEIELFESRKIQLKNKKIEMEKAEAIHTRLKKRVQNIKRLYEKYSNLLELKELQLVNNEQTGETEQKLNTIKFPEDVDIKRLRTNIDRFDHLKTIKNTSEKAKIGITRVNTQIKDLKPVSIDLSELRAKIERYGSIKAIFVKFSQIQDSYTLNQRNKKIIEKDIGNCINRYKALLKEAKVCPICQNECTEEHLKEIKL